MDKKTIRYLILGLIFLFSIVFSYSNDNQKNPSSKSATSSASQVTDKQTYLVTKVVDGDTIEIEGGYKLRYIGIDTPETVDPGRLIGCFGKKASAKNKELVLGKKVRLEKDISETDKYGRRLRYVYLPAGVAGLEDVFVNQYLVEEGFAKASSYPPDIKYQEVFRTAEKSAREGNKGLWGSCGSGNVQGAVTDTNNQTSSINSETCTIKGNISSSKEKIYHLPGQKYYDKTIIDESKGERWFCTETDAQKSGWQRSKV